MLRIHAIHHVSVLVANTSQSLAFYHGILGLDVMPERPELAFPGAWLRIGTQQLHLLELPNPDPVAGRPEHGGRDRHLALQIEDLGDLAQRLEAAGIHYSMSHSGRRALFCRDPDGHALEFIESPPVG